MSIEDEIWLSAAVSRALQEFRSSISGRWSDDASRAVSIRFLDPQCEDDRKMLDRRSQQQIANAFARSRLDLADARAAHASELSKRVENQITLAGQETRIAEQLVEIALNHHANALAMLPKIEETLRRAGCCCQGVQRR